MALFRSETPPTELQQSLEFTAESAGCAFKFALVGGSIFHFFKGLCRSPDGARLAGAWHAMGVNAPRVAGKYGAWFGLSQAVVDVLYHARQKDDHWNHIASNTIPTVLLSMHRGRAAAARFAALAAVLTVAGELSFPVALRFIAEPKDGRCLKDRLGIRSSSS